MTGSIASNIAEGFLYVAVGSANELDTQLEISKVARMAVTERLDAVQAQVTRITMMLRGLIRSLKAGSN